MEKESFDETRGNSNENFEGAVETPTQTGKILLDGQSVDSQKWHLNRRHWTYYPNTLFSSNRTFNRTRALNWSQNHHAKRIVKVTNLILSVVRLSSMLVFHVSLRLRILRLFQTISIPSLKFVNFCVLNTKSPLSLRFKCTTECWPDSVSVSEVTSSGNKKSTAAILIRQ